MSTHRIEDEVADIIRDAHERAPRGDSLVLGDPALATRLVEIEESLLALARYLDEAFAEIRNHTRATG